MKIRPSIAFSCLACLILVLLLVLHIRHPAISPIPGNESDSAQSVAPRTASGASNSVAASNVPAAPAPSNSTGVGGETKFQKMADILAAKNDVPIVFYGRLEDQFGNGIAGAQIAASIRIYNGTQSTVDRFSVESDANGQFQIDHGRGESLGLMPQKNGYALATSSTEFRYSLLEEHPYSPDPLHPTVIKMWKKRGAEHLINFNIKTYVPVDGTPILFDMQTGICTPESGDIAIHIESTANPNIRQEYEWRMTIGMIDGGIIESGGLGLADMFQAPEAGYEAVWSKSFKNKTVDWTPRFKDDFYFTSRRGKFYGKMSLEIDTDVVKNGAALVIINGFLNPNSSKNLEVDPAMVTGANP